MADKKEAELKSFIDNVNKKRQNERQESRLQFCKTQT